jgi:phenylalanyl-tRNA synthetase beta chain
LKEHLDTDASAATSARGLTPIGLEVESIADPGAALKDFIVGEVVTAEKHPNADNLRLVHRSATARTHCRSSAARPMRGPGSRWCWRGRVLTIPASGDVLKLGTIRGVESRGMMCSGPRAPAGRRS